MSELIKCPKCCHLFDVTEQMRLSIEQEVRSDIAQEIRDETLAEHKLIHNNTIESQTNEINILKDIINEVSHERDELKISKNKLENMKQNHKNEIEDVKAQARLEAKIEFNKNRETAINTRVGQETEVRDLRIKELELTLERLNEKVKKLNQSTGNGNAELIGEALEGAVLDSLKSTHPLDNFKEIQKGNYGADIAQFVRTNNGLNAGKILYECKYHKNWNDQWIEKIRKDGLGFDVLVIVTTTMPKDMKSFGEKNGVFICRFHELKVVSNLLRYALLRSNLISMKEAHKESIQERVIEYVSSPEFKFIMTNIMNAYRDLDDSIRREEQYLKKSWKSKRAKLQTVVDSMADMLGRLEAIGDATFTGIGFDLPPLLDEPKIDEESKIGEEE